MKTGCNPPLGRKDFEAAVVAHIRAQSGSALPHDRDYGRRIVDELLSSDDIEFGDDSYDWSTDGARILAGEEMATWEAS